jgi:SPP1 family predicted phage head-tail adaptor
MKLTFLDPGQLRTEMALQEPQEVSDGCGGFTITWTNIATVWAFIETTTSRAERFASRQIEEASHRVVLRFREGVVPGQRLVRGSTIYRIQLVSDLDGTARYLSCLVLEERP